MLSALKSINLTCFVEKECRKNRMENENKHYKKGTDKKNKGNVQGKIPKTTLPLSRHVDIRAALETLFCRRMTHGRDNYRCLEVWNRGRNIEMTSKSQVLQYNGVVC